MSAGPAASGQVIPLPAREFEVEVTYVIRMIHRVCARTVEEATSAAPCAEISGDVEIVDIIDARPLRDT